MPSPLVGWSISRTGQSFANHEGEKEDAVECNSLDQEAEAIENGWSLTFGRKRLRLPSGDWR